MRKGVNFDFNLDGATASLGSVLIYEAPLINILFVLKASATSASISKASAVVDDPSSPEISEADSNIRSAVDDKDIHVWHPRLGHLSLPAIKRLPNTVRGIQLHAMSPSTCTCEACIMGTMFRKPFQPLSSEDKAKTRLLELIHSDVIGPMQTQTMRGYQYSIMFTDDHSRYTEVYFMKAKSEAQAKFKEYVAKVEKQHPKSKVCRIRVDGGGEYASHEKFLEYLAEEGIIGEVSAPYSQQQNGISERWNRTVLDPVRSMLTHGGMPNKLWAEAVSTAVYIKNRLPSRALPNSTPFARSTRKKPDISHLRTFSCLAFAWIHGDLRKKLDNHAYKCVLLGYSAETSTQYRVMDVNSGRVFIARDVTFHESTLYHQLLKTKPTKLAFEPAEQDKDSEIEEPLKVVIQFPKAKVQPPKATALPCALNPIDDSDDDLTSPPETPPPEIPRPKPRRSGRTAANVSIAMMIEQGPKTYCAALDAEDAEQWKEAIGKEMASMECLEVFTFVDKVPEGASMIGTCWVMGRKLMANGTIDKWKVRLVGRGNLQKPADYNDITSPVIDSTSIRLALGLAAKHDLEIAILDIPTAFLGCRLQ
jgi:hypothetical protein